MKHYILEKSCKDKVVMDKKEFVDEHRKLIVTLKQGSKKKRTKEANEQEQELKHYIK